MTLRAWILTDAPYAGGAEAYLEWHLAAAGPEKIGVLAVARPGLEAWLDGREAEGFEVVRIVPSTLPVMLAGLAAWARRTRPALVHANLPGPYDALFGLAPAALRVGGACRVVVTEHLPTVGRVGRRYWAKRAGVGAIDRAITVCEAHAPYLAMTFGYAHERVVSIPNGVAEPIADESVARPLDLYEEERGAGPRVVQIGSLDPRKGPDRLIRAVAVARDRGVGLRLWLVGEGPMREELQGLIHSLRLEGRVLLTGHREDAAELWRFADVAVLASEREGMPLSLLEAAARGRAIVTTDVDGCPEVVGHGSAGMLVRAGDVDSLAAALCELALDPIRRARLGRAARELFHAKFRRERMVAATFAQYGEVAEGWGAA